MKLLSFGVAVLRTFARYFALEDLVFFFYVRLLSNFQLESRGGHEDDKRAGEPL